MKCTRCNGTGIEPENRELGLEFRNMRKRHKYTLRELASRMGISASYLCDLELGRRNWNTEIIDRFHGAL